METSFARDASVCMATHAAPAVFWNILRTRSNSLGRRKLRIGLSSTDSVSKSESRTPARNRQRFPAARFESLSRGGTSTREHGGLGLGLSIVKQLVQIHGGRVHAEVKSGTGARHHRLASARRRSRPCTPRVHDRNANDAGARDDVVSVKGLRVLIVDDEPDMRKMIATVLQTAGASVATVRSAAEAFEQLSEAAFDVLVSDIAMPIEDGHSLARRVRARNDATANIPAVALTAYGGPCNGNWLLLRDSTIT